VDHWVIADAVGRELGGVIKGLPERGNDVIGSYSAKPAIHCAVALVLLWVAGCPTQDARANDAEVRKAAREVRQAGATDEVEQVRRDIQRYREDAQKSIAGYEERIRQEEVRKVGNWQENIRKLRNQIKARQGNLDAAITQRIERASGPVSRLLTALRRLGGTALFTGIAFFTSDALGSLDAFASSNSKLGRLYRAALANDCKTIMNGVPQWRNDMEAELAARGVKSAPIVVQEFTDRIMAACRVRAAAPKPVPKK
jgi:Skp family chaperone for outer membrane proteins